MNTRNVWGHIRKPWVGAVFIFLLALSLRTCGLSHDLHLDRIYHPDTPKQIRAAERFIGGEYYTIIGGRDYEGYPYFNSHLVALSWRAYDALRHQTRSHLGLPHDAIAPDVHGLHWLTRVQNAVLSAMIALLLYLAGARYFNRATGYAAGLLMAVSPVDITAAHFGTGDTATSFFATCAVLAALGIARAPRWWLYALAAFLTGAAFSAKYHGGMALIAALVAHLTQYRPPRDLFSKASIGRLALLGVMLILGILVTSPALLIYPESAFKDILQFVDYTASFGMTREMAELPLWSRFLLGMQINMPVLADVLGPAIIAAVALAVLIGYTRRETWILLSLPLVYILAGLATKPLTHAVYHTLATPSLILLAASAIGSFFYTQCRPAIARPAGIILLALAFVYSANYAKREIFFFQHNDTRYLAETWARDNVPQSFMLDTRAYTFNVSDWTTPRDAAETRALVLARDERPEVRRDVFFSHAVQLEDDKLIVFRNWNLYFFMPNDPRFMQPGFQRPGFQPLPSPHESNVIFADAPWFMRTPKVRELSAPHRIRPTIVSDEPLDRILVHIHAGPEPARLRIRVAGKRHTLRLNPDETRRVWIEQPRPVFLTRTDRHFYSTRFIADYGTCRLFIATSDDEMAWIAFHDGAHEKAYALFDADRDQAPRLLSGLLSGERLLDDDTFKKEIDALSPDLFDGHGVTTAFLERLPGIVRTREELFEAQKIILEEEHTPLPRAHFHLEPGVYKAELVFSETVRPLTLHLTDPWDDPIPLVDEVVDDERATVTYRFEIDQSHRLVQLHVDISDESFQTLDELRITPDVPATLNIITDWLHRVASEEWEPDALRPMHYDWFLALADRVAEQEQWSMAARYYIAAIQSAPRRLYAYERLDALTPHLAADEQANAEVMLAPYHAARPQLERHPVNVRFTNGMRLIGYRIADHTVRRGDALGLNLYWETPRLDPPTARHAASLHGIRHGDSAATLHGDRSMRHVWHVPPEQDRLHPYFIPTPIPEDIATGRYALKAGVWIPAQRRTIRVREADIDHDRRGAFITEIEIVE